MTVWRYLQLGMRTHALQRPSSLVARCGVQPYGFDFWWGDDGAERERAAGLSRCARCVALLEQDFWTPGPVRR